jgi:phage tail sheath protein FI
MPISPTFPGVYIEEVPSGVRTIAGVGTAVTAFVGYALRGPIHEPVKVYGFADYERTFGPLDPRSDLGYAVYQYFLNGGGEAVVVRVASGALRAAIQLMNDGGAVSVLTARARELGQGGNAIRLQVAYDSEADPMSFFSLTVTEYAPDDRGVPRAARTERYADLSMNARSARYAVDFVNARSQLVTLERGAVGPGVLGRSISASLAGVDLTTTGFNATNGRIRVSINHMEPFDVDILRPGETSLPGAPPTITQLVTRIRERIVEHNPGDPAFDGLTVEEDPPNVLKLTSTYGGDSSAVQVFSATERDGAAYLRLGVRNGGTETDALAAFRPSLSGTRTTAAITLASLPVTAGHLIARVIRGTTVLPDVALTLYSTGAGRPTTLAQAAEALTRVLNGSTDPTLKLARAYVVAGRALAVAVDTAEANVSVEFAAAGADDAAAFLGLTTATVRNVSAYALGRGAVLLAQLGPVLGADGTPPASVDDMVGSQAQKTGFFALEKADYFSLVCGAFAFGSADNAKHFYERVLPYCAQRRAMLFVDLPAGVAPQDSGGFLGNLRHKNAVTYLPRLRAADPAQGGSLQTYPTSAAVAGVFARTDAERGVWKAPAGMDATLRGVQALDGSLTEGQMGDLNRIGLNCIRATPLNGHVVWGARTLVGDDDRGSEWKYVPVRRLALYLEESLYRGTQWAVFEPNDEPLWAQIRLNVDGFMRTLFRKGAFQGATPREAYLVKCDRETTTQDDIDRGVVNVVVGFAPLKPAEFVILKIQQLAGQIGA